jgi:asparagine synthetase B (glutamine-hydrolysing)
VPRLIELTLVDQLINLPMGQRDVAAPPLAPTDIGVKAALEQVMIEALSRPPCVVSFSGGRDSSTVLAIATDVARRHELPLPVPATMVFPGAEEAEESSWQRLVLDHLRLPEAVTLTLDGQADALGEWARGMLETHGLCWPGNAYLHTPVLETARGGTLITGIGGDEVYEPYHFRSRARAIVWTTLPRGARSALWRRRNGPLDYGWLTDEGRDLITHAYADQEAGWPQRWDRGLQHWYQSRAFVGLDEALPVLAAPYEVTVINPLLDRRVLSELLPVGGPRGFATRAEGLRAVAAGLLPDELFQRQTKAVFDAPVWGPQVRAFAQRWDGAGVDGRFVDPDRLRDVLRSERPDFRTILLLHRSWLNAQS